MIANKEIRALARADLKDNWTQPVLATLVYIAITGVAANIIPVVGFLITLLIGLPLGYSFALLFLRFVRGGKDNMVQRLFDCFQDYGKSFGTAFMVGLYTFLWSLLFIIPGIIKGLSYGMTYYISKDHPEYSIDDCINASMKMMDGHKMDLFLLELSFIGWALLSILTLGIGMLWVYPYMQTSIAHFYEQLKAEQPVEQPVN